MFLPVCQWPLVSHRHHQDTSNLTAQVKHSIPASESSKHEQFVPQETLYIIKRCAIRRY
ncbi:hypothetical protein PILCRDRAFT_328301 [Piloderma croceum F 1598]|uniref:Uncharacterized protein n=1 Tax=Piloderma croceum (strain F 1598) TaxID=765440 RepID=A0A0C3G1X9_PILCF|nr:hypothetical protein PILCRDRAFT_328301 [Piloderma croceum F 1598]